jgi:hypothetical protein
MAGRLSDWEEPTEIDVIGCHDPGQLPGGFHVCWVLARACAAVHADLGARRAVGRDAILRLGRRDVVGSHDDVGGGGGTNLVSGGGELQRCGRVYF